MIEAIFHAGDPADVRDEPANESATDAG